jgi:hypothetical protein
VPPTAVPPTACKLGALERYIDDHLRKHSDGTPLVQRTAVSDLYSTIFGRRLNAHKVTQLQKYMRENGGFVRSMSTLTCYECEGRLNVLDGNHRLTALKSLVKELPNDAEQYGYVNIQVLENLDAEILPLLAHRKLL